MDTTLISNRTRENNQYTKSKSTGGLIRFKYKVVVITGAASGIGRRSTLRLASEVADIVALDLSEERLTSSRAEITKLNQQ